MLERRLRSVLLHPAEVAVAGLPGHGGGREVNLAVVQLSETGGESRGFNLDFNLLTQAILEEKFTN